VGVDFGFAVGIVKVADGRNSGSVYGDVALARSVARAVVNLAIADEEVEFGGTGERDGKDEKDENAQKDVHRVNSAKSRVEARKKADSKTGEFDRSKQRKRRVGPDAGA
jgi:hypothetical protein